MTPTPLKLRRVASKGAASERPSFDNLQRTPTGNPRTVAQKAAAPKVDPRIAAIVPPLARDEARLLDSVLSVYEGQPDTVKRAVSCAASDIMACLSNVSREEASAIRATLVGRGLLVEVRDGLGSPGLAVKPGVMPALPD